MRQFKIGNMTYDYDTGKVTSIDCQGTLRAKSNDVLLYLLKRPQKVISKQEILDNVWDDVAAQEHVLFQSIKEIRQCFAEFEVIKTHPRKGYEWIAPGSPIEIIAEPASLEVPSSLEVPALPHVSEQLPNQHGIKHGFGLWKEYKLRLVGAAVIVSTMLLSWQLLPQHDTPIQSNSDSQISSSQRDSPHRNTLQTNAPQKNVQQESSFKESNLQEKPPKFVELVITPVKIHPQDNLTQWVPIGAMDMLIQKVQQADIDRKSGGIFVVDTEDVLEAIKRADAKHIENNELQSRELRHAMGEITSLHTELLGSPMEYTLKYSLINRHDIKQGLLTGENVVQIVNQLARSLPQLLDMKTTQPFLGYEQKFANDAFIFGLSHFYQNKMTTAEDYFRAAIASGDQFPQSRRYLAKSIAAQGKLDEAKSMALIAVDFARDAKNTTEELRSLFELGANQWRTGEIAQAKQNIKLTQTLAKQGKDLLYLAFAIEMLGQFALENHEFDEAEHYFSEALNYHQGFQCPYGRSSNFINLSKVASKQGRIEAASDFLQDALNVAQQNELVYFETRIHLLMAREKLARQNSKSMAVHLSQAQRLVDKHPNKNAEWVLKNWPSSALKIH